MVGSRHLPSRSKPTKPPDASDAAMMLNVLSAVERDSRLTQRRLSRDLGIALGLANSYLRRCIGKGLIKVSQVPLNRYAYYLTPQGFAEKSRLTVEYLTWSFEFFRRARKQCSELLARGFAAGSGRIVLLGTGELAEIALLSAGETGIEILCVIDPDAGEDRCGGRPVVRDIAQAQALCGERGFDALMVTDLRDPHRTYQAALAIAAARNLPPARVLVPDLLQVSDGRGRTESLAENDAAE